MFISSLNPDMDSINYYTKYLAINFHKDTLPYDNGGQVCIIDSSCSKEKSTLIRKPSLINAKHFYSLSNKIKIKLN